MLGGKKATKHEFATDAAAADFCRIFDKDMEHLYLLSFLLTADPQLAEDCFVRGLESAIQSNRVFKEWADAWARRMVIQNAIQIIQPQLANTKEAGARQTDEAKTPARVAAITALPALERFVFVISVLERYSDQDTSLLLGSTRADVIAARTRALQHIADSAELQRQLSIAVDERSRQGKRRSAIQYNPVLQLAASV